MLDKKIEEAASQRRQNYLILGLITLIILLGGAVFFLLSDKVVQTANSLKPVPEPAPNPVLTTPQNNPSEPASAEKTTEDRQAFLKLLSRYEEELEPVLKNQGITNWNGDLQASLMQRKTDAVDRYAAGEAGQALEQLTRLMEEISNALAAFEKAFQDQLQEAGIAYDTDRYEPANIAIHQALSYKPDDPDALALRERIEALPEILDLIRQAAIARTENNLEEELRLSEAIVTRDPDRTDYAQRAADIAVLLKEARFEKAVVAGLDAFRTGELGRLEKALATVRSLYPDREETRTLAGKAITLKKEFAFNGFLKAAASAIKADRWKEAEAAFQKASALKASHKEVVDGLDLSRTILKHQATVRRYLKAPGRLSSTHVASAARDTLKEADLYGSFSPSLKLDLAALQTAIEDQNTPVEVIIISDNLTDIQVRGVGKVGLKKQYRIELKPGQYVFEGRREGYKTKSVPVDIATGMSSIQVEIIADERI